MAALSYNKAVSDADGTIGEELLSGVANYIFPQLTWQQRQDGEQLYKKVYLTDIVDVSALHIGILNDGLYEWSLIEAASDAQIATDLTGSERKYGAASIVQSSTNQVVINNPTRTLFYDNDKVSWWDDLDNDIMVDITTVTDNGDGTSTLTFASPVHDVDSAGLVISSMVPMPLLANTPKSFWVETTVLAASAFIDTVESMRLLLKGS